MNYDPSGHFILSVFATTLLISAVVGGAFGGMTAAATGQSVWGGIIGGAVAGLISGAALYFAAPLLIAGGWGVLSSVGIAFGGGFAAGVAQYSINQGFNNNSWDLGDATLYGLSSGIKNVIALPFAAFACVGGTYFAEAGNIAATIGEKAFEVIFGGMLTTFQTVIWSLLDIGAFELDKFLSKRKQGKGQMASLAAIYSWFI